MLLLFIMLTILLADLLLFQLQGAFLPMAISAQAFQDVSF